jgi:hypothetical protein
VGYFSKFGTITDLDAIEDCYLIEFDQKESYNIALSELHSKQIVTENDSTSHLSGKKKHEVFGKLVEVSKEPKDPCCSFD